MTLTPEPRSLHYGLRGNDVLAAQRALTKAMTALSYVAANRHSSFFGHGTSTDVIRFQRRHALKDDAVIGAATWAKLEPFIDRFGRLWLLKHAPNPLPPTEATRLRIIAEMHRLYQSRPRRYAQERPYPPTFEEWLRRGSDCSGSSTLADKLAALLPDPNRLGYNGEGFTGTLVQHGARIPEKDIIGGELTFYGSGSVPEHVVVESGIPGIVWSHGSWGGPRQLIRHYRSDYQQTRRYV